MGTFTYGQKVRAARNIVDTSDFLNGALFAKKGDLLAICAVQEPKVKDDLRWLQLHVPGQTQKFWVAEHEVDALIGE